LRSFSTPALLVRLVSYGESDVIATLLTEVEGKLGVMVRGGRKSTKRVGGALEPIHSIEVRLEDRGSELATLKEAKITKVRAALVTDLDALEAAGTALRWVRHVCPPRTPEPEAWGTVNALLDGLNDSLAGEARGVHGAPPKVLLAEAGLRLLADMGYGLDLERCIQCGKECPADRSARVDPARGGLLCSSCGRGPVVLGPALRRKAVRIRAPGREAAGESLTPAEADELLAVVDAAMAAHAGFDR
jgi:DNA repair protein RecO (recombination protein O)